MVGSSQEQLAPHAEDTARGGDRGHFLPPPAAAHPPRKASAISSTLASSRHS